MEIKTKYNVGDTLYVIHHGKPTPFVVTSVDTLTLKDRQYINYIGKINGVSYMFNEERCGTSIEEINKIEEQWQNTETEKQVR